jgi:peptide/nickel transport system permease protein
MARSARISADGTVEQAQAVRARAVVLARRFAAHRTGLLGLSIVLFFALVAVCAPFISPANPNALVATQLLPPSRPHPFGTDDLGRDVTSEVIFGARVSLTVGFVAAAMSTLIGIAVGAVSGYYGGRVDAALMRLTELFQVIPQFALAVVIVALAGPGVGKIIFVIGILSWPQTARLVRGEFLVLKGREFVEAARALGLPASAIIVREILPNAISPAIITGALGVARAILLEAGLAFIGLGDPAVVSWGRMLNEAQNFVQIAWWMSVWPGVAVFLVVVGFNLLGDGLNDTLNPRVRVGIGTAGTA